MVLAFEIFVFNHVKTVFGLFDQFIAELCSVSIFRSVNFENMIFDLLFHGLLAFRSHPIKYLLTHPFTSFPDFFIIFTTDSAVQNNSW